VIQGVRWLQIVNGGGGYLLDIKKGQSVIFETARRIGREVLEIHAEKVEEEPVFPEESISALKENNYFGLLIPMKYGGMEESYLNYVIVMEELSKYCVNTMVAYSVHNIVSGIIERYGTEDQKNRYLPDFARGEKLGAICIAESFAGSDVGGIRSYYVKEGKDFNLVGRKAFVSSGGVADCYLVFARSSGTSRKEGITCFIVGKNAEGVGFGRPERKMGMNGSPTSELILDGCKVTLDDMIGKEGEGFDIIARGLAGGRISVGAMSVGLGSRAFHEALSYSKERIQFGRAISSFQAIQFMLADMSIHLEASRLLVRQAAVAKDCGEDYSAAASRAKTFASDAAMKITTDAVQILGGYGYLREYKVERYMRQAKLLQIAEGTNEIQRLLIVKDILTHSDFGLKTD